MKTTTKEKHAKAYKYYLMGLNSKEIAKLLDVSFRTVQDWSYKHNWCEKRKGANSSQM